MSKESLLAKARQLIATRLEQAQVHRGNGVVIYNSERSTISIDPTTESVDILGQRKYLAGEIVSSGTEVRIAPFVIGLYNPCEALPPYGGPYYPYGGAINPSFPYLKPKIGGTNIDNDPAPVLSTASSGTAFIKATWDWGQWTNAGAAKAYYYLSAVEVVTYPITEDAVAEAQRMYETEGPEPNFDRSYVLQYASTDTFTLLGWWEDGGRPVQFSSNTGAGYSQFASSLTDNSVDTNNNFRLSLRLPSAYTVSFPPPP